MGNLMPSRIFHTPAGTANCLRGPWASVHASVIGRHLFDHPNDWNGHRGRRVSSCRANDYSSPQRLSG
jgi:hypothetical protein